MRRILAGWLVVVVLGGLWLWSATERSASVAARAPGTSAEPALRTAELVAPLSAPDALPAGVPEPGARDEPAPSRVERSPAQRDSDVAHAARDLRVEVVVEVVDPARHPLAGIPLRLDPGGNALPEGTRVPEALVTDAHGRAHFPGIRPALEDTGEPWTLVHELPFEEPPRLVLARAALAAPVVVSSLPWGGPLEVAVRELDGAPAPRGSTLQLQLLRPEDGEGEPTGPHWKVELAGGAARFPWVELGRTWELKAWRPDGAAPARARAAGPRLGGEGARVELVLGADHPVVSYRVLDERRRPLASAAIELARPTLFGSLQKTALETDAQGRFTIDGEAMGFRSRDLVVNHRTAAGTVLQGRARLPRSPEPGWNEGGDILLANEPLLCAGRVLDEGGDPVSEASVVAGREQRWSFGDSGTVRGHSDSDGRFELRGLLHADELDLHAEADGQRSEDLRVHQGAQDVVLVLTPRHTLRGRLVLDPGVDPQSIRFALQAPGEEAFSVDRRRESPFPRSPFGAGELHPPEHFALEPVRAGSYDLLLRLEGYELARVPGLSLRRDVDVGAVDLRGSLRVCEIELLGAEEPAALAGEFSWRASDSGPAQGGKIEGSRLRILTPTLPIDVELRPRGFRQATLAQVSGRRTHPLEPALRVRLVLDTAGELPSWPSTLGCELFRADVNVGDVVGPRWFTRENRALALRVSTPGTLVARWHLERRIEGASFGGAMGSHVLAEHWRELEVLDVPGEQTFVLELDGEALAQLVRDPPW